MTREISLDEAKPNKLFYFVVNGVIYRERDARCLILKRSERETTHPGLWAVVGGKLEHEDLDLARPDRVNGDVLDFLDAIPKLLKREIKEEAGVEIEDELIPLRVPFPFVRPDGIPVVFAQFAVKYKSGEVKIEEGAFSDSAWVNAAEAKTYECIEGIPDEIAQTIKLFN